MNVLKDFFLTFTGSVLFITVGVFTVFYQENKVQDQVPNTK